MSMDTLAPRGAARLVTVALSLTLSIGCDDTAANTDAGADVPVVTDVPVTTDVPAVTDAPAGDGGACTDFTGTFSLAGTCSVPGFSPFPIACITQTGCTASIVVSAGTLPGTVSGNTLTFSATVSSIPLTCTVTKTGANVTAHCVAAGNVASCDATGSPVSFPGATRYCCDVHAQDCGAGLRCNIIGDDAMSTNLLTACVPGGASVEAASCTRTAGRVGAEDCGPGLFCANFGNPSADMRTCQRLCRVAGDCRAGESCSQVSLAPHGGVCAASCALLGTDCAAGTCRGSQVWTSADPAASDLGIAYACQPVGAVAEGAACANSNGCAANLVCRNSVCRRMCDMTHACPSGQTCSALTGVTNTQGYGSCM